MKTIHSSLTIIITTSLLTSAVLTGCGKGKHDMDKDLEWGDTTGFQWGTGELPDSIPHVDEKAEKAKPVMDTFPDPQSAAPAKKASKHRSYDGYDDDDHESAADEADKERRMKKLNRDFDAGLYGEHTRGFDRDNYDPDLDDW